jgi:hypothetical protein
VTDHDDVPTGGPVLDRQDRPPRLDVQGRPLAPSRVALELGTPFSSLLVRLPVLIGGACLLAVTVDAIVRIGRSVRAWMPVHPAMAWFRMVWLAVLVAAAVATAVVMIAAVVA